MKRALSLLLAVVMVLCVVSCGGKPELKFGSYNATASVQMGEMAMTWNMVLSLNLDMTFTLVNDKGEEKGAGTWGCSFLLFGDTALWTSRLCSSGS